MGGDRRKQIPFAIANITHQFIVYRCAPETSVAERFGRIHDNDVVWATHRIKNGPKHTHDGNGKCLPVTERLSQIGCR